MTELKIKRVRQDKKAKKREPKKPKSRRRNVTNSQRGLLKRLAAAGATNLQMAAGIDKSERTFYRLMQHDPKLYELIAKEKSKADDGVEVGLFSRAMGMEVTEVVEEPAMVLKRVHDGKEEKVVMDPQMVVTKRTTILIPPETKAALNWLANRRPDIWKMRQIVGNDPSNPLPGTTATATVVMMPGFKKE